MQREAGRAGARIRRRAGRRTPRAREGGFSLLEVMVASMLVILVFAGVSQYYVGGRRQLDYEEVRRAATEILADRFDGIRREYVFDELPALNGTDTTYVLYNRSVLVSHVVVPDFPEVHSTTMRLTASWTETVAGAVVTRSMDASTILARGQP